MTKYSNNEFIEFCYLYRDSSNFKTGGSIFLKGTLSDLEKIELINCLDGRDLFIAEQINIPVLYNNLYKFSNGHVGADHCWHEFSHINRLVEIPKDQKIWGSTEDFITIFRQISDWNLRLSPHYDLT